MFVVLGRTDHTNLGYLSDSERYQSILSHADQKAFAASRGHSCGPTDPFGPSLSRLVAELEDFEVSGSRSDSCLVYYYV